MTEAAEAKQLVDLTFDAEEELNIWTRKFEQIDFDNHSVEEFEEFRFNLVQDAWQVAIKANAHGHDQEALKFFERVMVSLGSAYHKNIDSVEHFHKEIILNYLELVSMILANGLVHYDSTKWPNQNQLEKIFVEKIFHSFV